MKKLWKRSLSLMLALAIIVGILPMSAIAATAHETLDKADGILWLYDNNGGASDEFLASVMGYELDNMIRKAVGEPEDDESIKVTYPHGNLDADVGTSAVFAVAQALADEVIGVLKSKDLIVFKVGGHEKKIAVRTIDSVGITLKKIVISDRAALADLEGKVEELLQMDAEGYNDYLTIEHNGVAKLNKTRHETVIDIDDSYEWPTAAESKNGGVKVGTVTVTVYADDYVSEEKTPDRKQVASTDVVLQDLREVLTDVYDYSTPSAEGKQVKYHYYADEEVPAAPEVLAESADGYYTSTKWELNADEGVYYLDWTPKVDISAPDVAEPDGIADQTQKFTITYVLDKIFIEGKPADGEIGTDLEMYEGVAYGAMTPAVTGTPEYPGTEYSLGGWVDANGKAASATVKGAAVYFPNFTKNPIATFEFYLDEELVDSTTVAAVLSNGNYVVVPDDYAIDGYILHLAYNATTGNEVNLPLTTFNIEGNTTVQLYFYSDSDKNGKFDGTEDDPLYVYNYYLENSNTPGETKTVLKSENFDVQSVQYPADQLGEDEKFMGWQVSVAKKVENAGIAVTFVTYTHECKPIIITDKNNNGKDDSLEEDFVTLAGGVGDYELVDGNLKITNGEYTGWIKITDLEGKSILLPGENGGVKFSYDPATTVITASPLWNADKTEMSHYVADIKVKGESAGTYEDFNLVCAPIAQANGVMLTADENVQVEVIYATATAFEKADAEANTLKPAQPSYDEAEVYAAAIKTPAFSDAISIQYAARIAGPVTVKLDGLLGQMNGTKLEMLKPALETFLNGKTTYEFNLSTKYLDISASVTNRTPDAIANEYFKEVVDNLVGDGDTPNMAYYNQIGGIDGIIRELESRLDANANLHKFGMVTTENLSITYQTDAEYAHTDLVLVIEDPRPATKIVAKNTRLEKAYSSFDNDDLLANVELQLADGSVVSGELDLGGVNYAKMDVGEYQVKVNFQGNEDYRDSEGAFTLVVTPADASVQVPEKITVMAGGQYNPAPQDVTPENMAVVHMIAGFEMNELAFNEAELLQNGNFVLDEDTIEIKVWLKMPAMLAEVASGMGVDFESNEFVDLKEVQSLIGRDADTTIQTYYKDYVEQLLAQLPGVITDRLNLQGLSEANIAVKIRIDTLGDQTYPVNPGLYLNMAANLPAITKVAEISGAEIPEEYASIVNDKNYTAAYSTGYIVISPMVPVPNSGGVELFYKNTADTQNVFTFANGTEAALKVAVNGVELEGATPTYYGLNTSLDQVTGVPSEPGLYIAFYNHTATVKNEITGADEIRRLGSDFALILINKSSASLEIVDETVTYDGEAHLPAIKVKANGAVVTDAAVTVISGSVNSGSATSITELQANINIDFPAKLDALWNKYWQSKGQAAPNTATPNDVVAFLKYCKTTIIGGAEDALVLMEGLGIPTGYVDGNIQNKLENGIDQATVTLQNLLDRATIHLDNLIAEVEKIGSKFDDEVTLTIKDLDELDYTATGYYLFAGIVTDPQYTPAVGAGLLTITSLHEYEMYETRVPYDGEPHFIDMTNESGRDSIYIIVDDNGDVTKVNFRLDNNLTTVMEALLDKAGYEPVNGSNVVVGTAYKKGEAVLTGKTQDFLDAVKNQIDENALIEKLENEITEKSKAAVAKLYPAGSEEYNKALNKMLEEKIPAAIDELRNKTIPQFIKEVSAALQKLDKLENDTLVIVNGEKPVEVGEYQIYGYNYDVAKASGTLYIVDAYEIAITVEPDSYTMDSGEATPVVEITVKKNGELIDEDSDDYKTLINGYLIDEVAKSIEDVLDEEGTYIFTISYNESEDYSVTGGDSSATLTVIHEHVFDQKVADDDFLKSEANCTEAAVYYKSCKCGEKGEETFEYGNALGHTEGQAVKENEVAPDCENEGSYESVVYCTDCNAELSRVTITVDALGHTEEVIAGKDATCTETGLTDGKKCTVCGKTTVAQEVIPAKGHTEETVAGKDATCTETGLTDGKKCTVCGKTTVAQEVIPAKGHTEEIIPGKDATCLEDGLTEGKKCTVCGKTTVAQEVIKANGKHTWDTENYTTTKEPTCALPGIGVTVCTVCGEINEEYTIPALGHNYVVTLPGKAATCEYGYTDRIECGRCGDIKQQSQPIDPIKDHTWNILEEYEAPTCALPGSGKAECTVCGKAEDPHVIPALGHDVVTVPGKAATCLEDGYTAYEYCARCGHIVKPSQVLPAKGGKHNWDHVVTKSATCQEKGAYTDTCLRCGAVKTGVIDYASHTGFFWDRTKEPTCTEAGIETSKCIWCEKDMTRYVNALGHDSEDWHVTKAATCTESGEKTGDCARCGATNLTETIPALGHNHVKVSVITAATCTAYGKDQYKCTRCDNEVTRDTAPLGHDWKYDQNIHFCGRTGCDLGEPIEHYKEDHDLTDGKCDVCGYTFWIKIKYTQAEFEKYPAEMQAHFKDIENLQNSFKEKILEKVNYELNGTKMLDVDMYQVTETDEGTSEEPAIEGVHYTSGEYHLVNIPVPEEIADTSKVDIHVFHMSEKPVNGEYVVEEPSITLVTADDGTQSIQFMLKDFSPIMITWTCNVDHNDPANHETVAGKDATCTETGLTEGTKCSVCGETLTEQRVIPATGHTPGAPVHENVTQNSYEEVVYCAVCKTELSRVTISTTKTDVYYKPQDIEVYVGEEIPASVNTDLILPADNSVLGYIPGMEFEVYDADGNLCTDLTNLPVGTYTIKLKDGYTVPNTLNVLGVWDGTLTVKEAANEKTSVTIKADNVTATVGTMPELTVTVTDTNGNEITGVDFNIEFNVVDANGQEYAGESLKTLPAGTYTIYVADWKAPDGYEVQGLPASGTLTVKPAKIKVWIKPNDATVTAGQMPEFSATIKQWSNNQTVNEDFQIVYGVMDKRTYEEYTDLTNLPAGEYYIFVKSSTAPDGYMVYGSSSYYGTLTVNPRSVTVTISDGEAYVGEVSTKLPSMITVKDGDEVLKLTLEYALTDAKGNVYTENFDQLPAGEYTVTVGLPDGYAFATPTIPTGKLTVKEAGKEYAIGMQIDIRLHEPWAMRAYGNVYPKVDGEIQKNNKLTQKEVDQLDYGVYFLRASDINKAFSELTIEDFTENDGAYHFSKNDEFQPMNSLEDGSIMAEFAEGIYADMLAEPIYTLYYVVDNGVISYSSIKERNLIDNLKDWIQDGVTEERTQTVINAYQALVTFEEKFIEYIGENKGVRAELQSAPTLAEYSLPTEHKFYNVNPPKGKYFSYTNAIALVEPWSLKLDAYVNNDTTVYQEYGFVVFHDKDNKFGGKDITVEQLLAEQEEAYVFSTKNGDIQISKDENGRLMYTAEYNKDIYSYQLDKTAYVMFYVYDGTDYHYGPVKARVIMDIMDEVYSKSSAEAKAVFDAMKGIYNAIIEYRK